MLKKQIFKSLAGAQRRCAFENAHSNFKWNIVRCLPDGTPDNAQFERGKEYAFRLLRTKQERSTHGTSSIEERYSQR